MEKTFSKKIFSILICSILITNMSFVVCFGEINNTAEPLEKEQPEILIQTSAVTPAVTPADVSRGLLFCREYPVTVQIDGINTQTNEKEVPPLIIAERILIPARSFFESMGAVVSWNEETRVVTVESEANSVDLLIDSTIAKVNGEEKILEVPAMIVDHDEDGTGSTMVPIRFISEVLGAEVSWEDATRTANIIPASKVIENEVVSNLETKYGTIDLLNDSAKEKLIFIDIGHGGKDSGAIANEDMPDQLYEKDINLEIGLILKELLDKAGAKYLFNRTSDTYLSLLERPALANTNNADIYIAIHNNSSEYSKPQGTEVYYYSKVNEQGLDEATLYGIYSEDIAKSIQYEMVNILGTSDRGIKESEYLAVLNKTSMPAIAIEGAFLSNPVDLEIIRGPEYAEKYAFAIAKGLITSMNQAF